MNGACMTTDRPLDPELLKIELALEQGICKGLEFRLLEIGNTLEEVLAIGMQSCQVIEAQTVAMKKASEFLRITLEAANITDPSRMLIRINVVQALDVLDEALAVE